MKKHTRLGTCALCRQSNVKLQVSHYLPRSSYCRTRADTLSNKVPVIVSGGKGIQSQSQVKDYLLCASCEGRFNTLGEAWVLGRLPNDYDDPFSMRDCLAKYVPMDFGEGVHLYKGAGIAEFDMDQLNYFAASLFWRGAAHTWPLVDGGRPPKLELGKCEEQLRKFLLGQKPLPPNLSLTIHLGHPGSESVHGVLCPHPITETDYFFYIFGLGFVLSTNAQQHLPDSYHSKDQFVWVTKEFTEIVRKRFQQLLQSVDQRGLTAMRDEIRGLRG